MIYGPRPWAIVGNNESTKIPRVPAVNKGVRAGHLGLPLPTALALKYKSPQAAPADNTCQKLVTMQDRDPSLIFSLYLLGSLLLGGLGWPLFRNWVPPNRWYGCRTRRTIGNPKIWYPVNRVTGFWLIATGLVTAVVATLAYMGNLAGSLKIGLAATLNAATYVIGLLVTAVRIFFHLEQR
ncbi:MAG: SdpI family protein [Pirellulales bacterium]|nr:SdpI family protein [Pirellulales bacterium]